MKIATHSFFWIRVPVANQKDFENIAVVSGPLVFYLQLEDIPQLDFGTALDFDHESASIEATRADLADAKWQHRPRVQTDDRKLLPVDSVDARVQCSEGIVVRSTADVPLITVHKEQYRHQFGV